MYSILQQHTIVYISERLSSWTKKFVWKAWLVEDCY